MFDKECAYCRKFFDCKGKAEAGKACVNLEEDGNELAKRNRLLKEAEHRSNEKFGKGDNWER